MYNPTLSKRKIKEYLNGELISSGVTEHFKYGTVEPRAYTSAMANGIPIPFVAVTEKIYTSNTDLKFAEGKPIKMHDGKQMTIENTSKDINEYGTLLGYFISLNGGNK